MSGCSHNSVGRISELHPPQPPFIDKPRSITLRCNPFNDILGNESGLSSKAHERNLAVPDPVPDYAFLDRQVVGKVCGSPEFFRAKNHLLTAGYRKVKWVACSISVPLHSHSGPLGIICQQGTLRPTSDTSASYTPMPKQCGT